MNFSLYSLMLRAPAVLAQRQPVLHFDAERVDRIDRLARIGDDGLLLRLHFGQEMPFDLGIERKLDHFGVDHHELQLRRMLLVEQRGDNGVQSHRLALSRGTGHQQVGHFRKIEDVVLVLDRAADHHRGSSAFASWNFIERTAEYIDTICLLRLGTSIPMVPLPGSVR